MNRTVSVRLCDKINCCAGDTVSMTVKTVSKLVSYGSACEVSEVPAFVVGTGINSDGTFTYVVRYCDSVLRDKCNYLVPEDIAGLCCTGCCGEPSGHIQLSHIKNNSCPKEDCCVNIIKGVNCG